MSTDPRTADPVVEPYCICLPSYPSYLGHQPGCPATNVPECEKCGTVLAFPGDECGLCKCSSLCAPGEPCALTESGVCKENKNE